VKHVNYSLKKNVKHVNSHDQLKTYYQELKTFEFCIHMVFLGRVNFLAKSI